MTLAVIVGALLLSAITYGFFERLGRRSLVPFALRAVAWSGLGILLVNVSCPTGSKLEPLVLLDGSLSMRRDSAAFDRLLDSLSGGGSILFFGDERSAGDADPRGRSRLRDGLRAAIASGRQLRLITDGEIDDATEVSPELLSGVHVDLRPRADSSVVALTRVRGSRRVTAGDTLMIEGTAATFGHWTGDSAMVVLRAADRELGRTRVGLAPAGRTRFRISGPTRSLSAGEHLLTVSVEAPGVDSATAVRWHHLTVVPTPGIVLIADPGDWDSRFLFRALIDVSDLPVRGFVKLANDQWRSMEDLAPVTEAAVRRAARGADLLVLKGQPDDLASGSRARGVWHWPSGQHGEAQLEGDWYLTAGPASPLAAAFAGVAVDSFPPAAAITPIRAPADEWVGLLAQEGRRGALRPVVTGGDQKGRRSVTVAAEGFWRWAFPGGASEQGYRAWVAATTSWLLGGTDTLTGTVTPVAHVVEQARPLSFRWTGPGSPGDLAVRFETAQYAVEDTLSFDGTGSARVWLPVGRYRYTTADGSGGVVAIEPYNAELLPRPVTLRSRTGEAVASAGRTSAREALWLFGLVILALAGEWFVRRRLGLR